MVEQVDGGLAVRRPEEVHEVREVRAGQLPAVAEPFQEGGIVLRVARVPEGVSPDRYLEAVGRDRVHVPPRLELRELAGDLDPHPAVGVRRDVPDEALALEVVPGDELRLLGEGAEDGVGRDDGRPAAAEELLDEPAVVVGVHVRQEHVGHVQRRDADLLEVGEGLGGRVDEDALAVDPDDEAGEVTAGIEAVAGAERRDAEARPLARELDRLAQVARDGADQARQPAHLEQLLGLPAVGLHEAHVEPAPAARHPHLRRRQRDDRLVGVERDEVHVVVGAERGAVRVRSPPRDVGLVRREQEVVGVARLHAVRLPQRLERRLLGRRRVEEAEQRQRQEAVKDVPLPGGAGDPRAHLLPEEEIQVDEELDVAVVGLALEEARGQDEQQVPLRPFAENVLHRLRQAAELHACRPVGAPQDGGVEELHGPPRPVQRPDEAVASAGAAAEGGHDPLVRRAAGSERRVPAHEVLLRLPEAAEDLVDEHEGPGVRGVDQEPDRPVTAGYDQRLPPRIAWRRRRHHPERDLAVRVDGDRPEPEVVERHAGELRPPPELLHLGLAQDRAQQVRRHHVEEQRLDGRLHTLRRQPDPGQRRPPLRTRPRHLSSRPVMRPARRGAPQTTSRAAWQVSGREAGSGTGRG